MFVKPLILWMWIGGLLMAVGTVLAAFPGRRRRNPLDPVSAPIPAPSDRAVEVSGARVGGSQGPDDSERDIGGPEVGEPEIREPAVG